MGEGGLQELCQDHMGKVCGKKLEPAGTSSKCLSGGKLERVTKLDCDRTRGWKTEPLEINILIFLSWHNKKTL